ncbi:cytochrome P450 [Streptomyces sp. RKAG293]|uniref:cytochrome P450 family protein n=1 Tax=Streptomyces sp. RKAG293 TaxID=2893403 RepID=UPI002033BF6D|nr:cytochrome P450 [Streptomyces sp. RKAG293]MCM2416600.1 cytochrome P450 [Streptomyces sp. RKAG293]
MDRYPDLTSWEPQFTNDPHPLYGRLRRESPVGKVVLEGLELWMVTRYEDVRAGLADVRFSSDPRNAGPAARAVPWTATSDVSGLTRNLLRTDGADHSRLRSLISTAFTARRAAAMRPRITEIAERLVAGFRHRGEADLITEFALPLPVAVIAELLGIPGEDRHEFVKWANIYTGVEEGDAARAPEALAAMRDYLVPLIERRRDRRADDMENGSLLDALITARDHGAGLDREELIAMAFLLLLAGYETTASLVGNGVLTLLQYPERLSELREHPWLIPGAVEELLRYESPVKISPVVRYATSDLSFGGQEIKAGDAAVFSLTSANRDPDHFADPGDLRLRRTVNRHLAFGHGVHYCLGAPLARAQAEIALSTLLAGCQDLALVDPEPVWRHSRLFRGLRRLPVTFSPSPAW